MTLEEERGIYKRLAELEKKVAEMKPVYPVCPFPHYPPNGTGQWPQPQYNPNAYPYQPPHPIAYYTTYTC